MTPRRSRAAVLALGAAMATTTVLVSPGVGQAQRPAPSLDFVSQTLVIDNDPAEIVVDVIDAPDDARIGVTVLADPASSRGAVRDHHAEPSTTGARLAAFECTLDGDCFDQAFLTTDDDGAVTITLDDAVIGELLRRDAGTLPVVVTLVNEDGDVLDDLATSFVVIDDVTARRGRVGFISSLDAPVGHHADQSVTVDPAPLIERLEGVSSGIATTFSIRPETLSALAEVDATSLAEIVELIDRRPLQRSPWVAMDEEAWRVAGEADLVIAGYALGHDTFEELAGTAPSGIVRLDGDATPATLSVLRAAGASVVIAQDDQLDPATRADEADQPLTILDDNGVAMAALRIDDALHDTLAGDDPELAGYHALAELLTALYDDRSADTAALLDIDRVNPVALDVLLTGIDEHRELRVVGVNALANLDPERLGGTATRAELRAVAAPDIQDVVAELQAARSAISTLSAMLEPETESVDSLAKQLRAAVSSDLTADEATGYADAVFAEVLERTAGVEVPPGDRITLTDRRTDLPLTIVNNQAVTLNVELVLSAEKIRFPDGERRELRLQPGDNDIVIPVETLASGDARVTATIVSPGGAFELASGAVDIRSTAISGLGLAISVVALVILGVWWIRTILRVRRNRAAATVAAASDEDPASPTEDPVEGES
ncbi:MAG: hypothetical protein DHS20C19_24690 [Acidimicrobiales bacterium]|nr:MAG: hypothetical protein DHS20C19_24690 [Acidimicrobiales bacterium]